jgi:hypothetical protein
MAQSGYTPILIYASSTPGALPSAANLTSSASGAELAINYADGKLYFKNSSGVVTLLAGSSSGPAGGSNTQVQYNNAGVLAGSSNMTFDGTSLTLGGNPTLSGGTANGVLYLNGSKVATSGSALVFDGSNLGLGTTLQNGTKLNVMGGDIVPATSGSTQNGGLRVSSLSTGSGGYVLDMGVSNTNAYAWIQVSNSANLANGFGKPLVINPVDGNLGLGVTPSAWNSSYKALQVGAQAAFWGNATGADIYLSCNYYYDGANKYIANGYASYYSQFNGAHSWFTAPSGTAGNAITFTQAMTLDASGNLLVGTTTAGSDRVRIKASNTTGSSIYNYLNCTNEIDSDLQIRITGSAATDKRALITTTTNTPIAFGTNDNERARITSGGDLLVGTTSSPAYGSKLRVEGGIETFATQFNVASGTSAQFELVNRSASAGFDFYVNSGGTLAARITSGGDLLVGTTTAAGEGFTLYPFGSSGGPLLVWNRASTTNTTTAADFRNATASVGNITYTNTATAYNTSSDYRLKDSPQPLTNSGTFIDALKPKTWNWKADGSKGVGFIAHEVQEVSPSSVTGEKDGEEMQAMEYGSAEFIANIIAELQSLRQRVAQLEGTQP